MSDPRIAAIPDVHGHAKGEHRPYAEERPIAYSARMLFLWFYHACRRTSPRFLMVADHANYLTFEDPGAVNTVRRALKLAHAGDLLGAAETAGVDVGHASIVSEGLRRGMRFSIGAEMDNEPRARPDAQNIVDALRPDGIIRSVHFLPISHPEKGPEWLWPFDNEEFANLFDVVGTEALWELYVPRLIDDVSKLPTQIVGHFYAPATFGHWPAAKKLGEYEDRLLDVCHERGLAVEINTRFLYRDQPPDRVKKYLEANARLIRKAKARGVGIAVGSGAHSPKDQGNAFDLILGLLDDAKINELVFPVGGRLARVALRATQEHLEAQQHAHRAPTAPGSSISGYSRAELGLPEEAEGARTVRGRRDSGPQKRVAGSARAAKKSGAAPAPGSRRSAESSSASAKAKTSRTAKPAPPPPKKAAKPPPKPPAKKTAEPPARAAREKKPAAKPAKPSAKPAAKKIAKPAAKAARVPAKKPSTAKHPAKAPARPAAAKKTAPKKTAAKKPAAKSPVKPKRAPVATAKKVVKKKKPAARRR